MNRAAATRPAANLISNARLALAAAVVLTTAGLASGQTVDGRVGTGNLAFGEYQFRLATQTTATGYGNLQSQLDAAYVNVLPNGSLQLALTGNLEENFNGLVIYADIGRPGAIGARGTRNSDGSGNFGDVGGPFTYPWGTRPDGSGNPQSPGSVFAPGFDPARAIQVNGGGGTTPTYYTNIQDLARPSGDAALPENSRSDYYLGSNSWTIRVGTSSTLAGASTPVTQTYNYANVNGSNSPGNVGDITHALDSSNGITFANGSPTANTSGYEAIISNGALYQAPGTQTKLFVFISGGSGFTSNQFLPGAPAGTSNINQGGLPTGGPLFDYRRYTDPTTGQPTITFLTVPTPTNAAGTTWSDGADGTAASAWSTAYAPNGVNTQASFSATSGNRTVAVNGNITVGTLYLTGPNNVSLTTAASGPSSLTFQALGNDRVVLSSTAGNHTVATPVTLTTGLNANLATGSSVTLTSVSPSAAGINVSGGGRLNIAGNYIGGPLTISNTTGTYGGLITLNGASVNIVRSTDTNTVTGLVAAAQAFLTSGGTAGLGLAGTLPANQGLAVFPNFVASDVRFYSNYGGQSLLPSDIILRQTYLGDTNIDGIVDGTDLANVIEGLSTPGAAGWQNGDFNYDGAVTLADLATLQGVLTLGLPRLTGNPSGFVGQVAGAVPEPTSMSLLAGAGLLLARRRR